MGKFAGEFEVIHDLFGNLMILNVCMHEEGCNALTTGASIYVYLILFL